jgi:hypothetical protein
MADAHLTYCESLGEWSTRCTCDERLPCADVAREMDLDRAEHYEREAGR